MTTGEFQSIPLIVAAIHGPRAASINNSENIQRNKRTGFSYDHREYAQIIQIFRAQFA